MCINIKTVAYQIENFANKIPKLIKGVVNDRLRATPQGDTTGRSVCCLVWYKYVTKRETNSLYICQVQLEQVKDTISFNGNRFI